MQSDGHAASYVSKRLFLLSSKRLFVTERDMSISDY